MRAATALLAATLALAGCAAGGRAREPRAAKPRPVRSQSAPYDSVTVLLWRFEETGGLRVAGAGPRPITGLAGSATQPDLGRVGGARRFTRSIESFVWGGYHPELETGSALTVEAWIRLDDFGQYEDTPIASRWNPGGSEQSWFLAVGGRNILPPLASLPGPGFHSDLLPTGVENRPLARLMFGFQPERAGAPRAFLSNARIELGRWTHVAATYESRVVRLYVNGLLDAQYAVAEGIRPSRAPLLVGNLIDERDLTNFEADVRVRDEVDHNPYYAFEGDIDELRISNVARADFPYGR